MILDMIWHLAVTFSVISFTYIGKNTARGIKTYSGLDKCNTSLLLDATNPAVILDIVVTMPTVKPDSETCYYVFDTADTPFFGMKALSTFKDNGVSEITDCSVEMSLSGNNLNKIVYGTIPSNEVNIKVYGSVTVEIKLDKCGRKLHDVNLFKLLVFKHGDNNCASTETMCSNATRCVRPDLVCNDVYDFCNNDFHNCQKTLDTTTVKRYIRKGPPSLRGIILGCVFVTALLSFLLYIIACRKRPCCKRITDKLCRLLPEDRRRGRTVPSVLYTHETNQISIHTNSFQEPPPRYTEIENVYHNANAHAQSRSEAEDRSLNIPPPLYSLESNDARENVGDELPPPYSEVPVHSDEVQHI